MDRTRYRSRVVPPTDSMLKSGRDNAKLGSKVRVGPFTGARIMSLTLEERRSCPTSCAVWDHCYGNNMPWALRHDHTRPDFLPKLAEAVERACKVRPQGAGKITLLLRLHVLGDFFSPDYVRFWSDQLDRHSNLAVFGYTAHTPDSPVGQEIHRMTLTHGWGRAAIRFSDYDGPLRGAVVSEVETDQTFTCPEQIGRVRDCANCGACWTGERSVRFIPH